MCDIFSAIVSDKKTWFLTSKDALTYLHHNPDKTWFDLGGHSGIKLVYPEATGTEVENFPVPKAMVHAINSGQLDLLNFLAHGQIRRVTKTGNESKRLVQVEFSEEVQKLAVQKNGWVIEYIKNPPEEVQKLAVQQNVYAIIYIKNPSEEVRKLSQSKL